MILFSFFCKNLSIAIIKRDKSYKSARLFFWRERERERERERLNEETVSPTKNAAWEWDPNGYTMP